MPALKASWSPRATRREDTLLELKAELCSANLLHGIAECAARYDICGVKYHYESLMKYHAPRYADRADLFRQILDDYLAIATNNGRQQRNIPYRH